MIGLFGSSLQFLPSVVGLSLVATLAGGPARAELPRVVVVLEEIVDGKKASTASAEVSLTASLNKDGYRLVSSDLADKLRRAQAVSMALSGGIPDVLSSMDADIAVLGQVEMTKIGVIAEAGLVGYRAAVVAKLVRVDTAQIVDAFTLDAKGNDFSDAGAAQRAARAAGDELSRHVKAAVASLVKKPKVIDLVVHGVPDRMQMDALKDALAKARGISGVTVRQTGKGITKLELTVASDAEAVASEFEKGGLPLEVVQTSASSILARFDLRRGVRLGMTVLPPTVKLAARGAWVKGVIGGLVGAELQNVAFVDVVEQGGDVLLAVDVKPAGADVALTMTVQDASKTEKLFVATGTGKLEALPALVSTVVAKLDVGFLPAVARAKPRGGDTALARAAAVGKKGQVASAGVPVAEVRLEAWKIDNIFPVKLGHYQEHPVGTVILQHSDPKGEPAKNVAVSFYVPRFMQLKSEVVVGSLAPGERREVPLPVTLDTNTVFALEENTPTQAEMMVTYDIGGGKMNARRVAPLIVYGRRAIDWTENAPVAAFVTPREEVVRTFARAALVEVPANGKKVPTALPESLSQAIAIFQGMSAAELRYVKDPAVPARSAALDTVQYARETLGGRTGDCDDLAVLYASLLESVGVETAFLLVPGHVLLGVAPGVPADAMERVTLDPARFVVYDSKAWVPVETTAVGKTFRDAWALGAAAVARTAGKIGADGLTIVETRAAWANYPPAALPRAAGLQVPRADPKKSRAEEEVRSVVAERDSARRVRLEELAAQVKKDPAGPAANTFATMKARDGDIAAARAILAAALEKTPGDVSFKNNLANLDVLVGASAAAVAGYRSILPQAGARAGEVLTNLGIAYTQAGDAAKAVEAFDAALAAGASSAFVATGFERTSDGVGVDAGRGRAADEAQLTVAEQDLKSVLQKALAQRKQKAGEEKGKPAKVEADRFANPLPSGARRGDDPQSTMRTAEILRWMP